MKRANRMARGESAMKWGRMEWKTRFSFPPQIPEISSTSPNLIFIYLYLINIENVNCSLARVGMIEPAGLPLPPSLTIFSSLLWNRKISLLFLKKNQKKRRKKTILSWNIGFFELRVKREFSLKNGAPFRRGRLRSWDSVEKIPINNQDGKELSFCKKFAK